MAPKEHHPSMRRLLEAAKAATTHLPQSRRISDFDALRAAMGASPQGWNAWKDRGISKEGALKGEELFGCSAMWVMTGEHPRRWMAESVSEPAAAYVTPAQALPVVLRAIAGSPASVRNELAQVLSLFAQSGADTYGLRIKELLGIDQRQHRLSRTDDSGRAEVNPRELENVIGGLIELAGTPSAEARAKGRRIARELTAPKPASATADQEADHGSAM